MLTSGPDKPIETKRDVIKFLKLWEKTMLKHFPYTAGRIHDCIIALNKLQ